MVAKKKATTGKGQVKKLKLKKETIRDLEVKGKDAKVKGGFVEKCSAGNTGCSW